MSIINLQQQMQELSLLGMQNSVETDLAVAIKQDWSYEELMSRLLQSEKSHRDEQFICKRFISPLC